MKIVKEKNAKRRFRASGWGPRQRNGGRDPARAGGGGFDPHRLPRALPPYNRPPLSKRYLLGEIATQDLHVLSTERYRDLAVDLLLETSATSIDPTSHVVATDRGGDIRYRKLLIATGGVANRLAVPGADLDGICCLRTVSDADALKTAAAKAKRAVVVGGSFLGMEVAATLSSSASQSRLSIRSSGFSLGSMPRGIGIPLGPVHAAERRYSPFASSGVV